jgi:hypothetical protein
VGNIISAWDKPYTGTPKDEMYRKLNMVPNIEVKYVALNLSSLRQFGSLEFRHAPVFKTVEELVLWINVIQCIVCKYRMRNSPLAVWDRKGPSEFLYWMFKDTKVWHTLESKAAGYEVIADKTDVVSVAETLAGATSITKDGWNPVYSEDEEVSEFLKNVKEKKESKVKTGPGMAKYYKMDGGKW